MKKILKKCLVVVAMVGVASILLTSCATPQPPPSSSSPTPASTQPATSFKPEDYMVSLEEDWPTFSDPAVGADFSDMIAVTNVYDALVFVNNDNTIKPWLAEKWEMSPDGKVWTFYLRKGVKFHNGETLKASDVVFTLKRYHTIGEGTSWLWLNIDDAKAIDDYTVQFTLKKPFGPFLYTLVRFYVVSEKEVMAHLKQPGPYGEYGDFAKEWLLTHDAGCGPYKIKEVKTEEYVLMEKFDDWWGGWDPNAPKLFKLFAEPDSSTIRSLLASRELEITDEWQAIETYKAFAQIPGVKIAKYLVGHNFALRFHCAKPPTDDVHFRRALAYCFDYNAVVDPEIGISPGSALAKGPCVSTVPGWDPNLTTYTYDLEKAKEELAKSKYADNPGAYPVTFYWAAEVPFEEKVALMLQANAAKIGIKVEITKMPFGNMIAAAQSPDTTPNIFTEINAPYYPEAGAQIQSEMHSSTQGTVNNTHWLGTILDQEIDDALATLDEKERFAKYAKLQQEIIDLCPTIWAFDQLEQRAVQTGYFYWVGSDLNSVAACSGYPLYVHDMRIYPEKKPK